MEITGCSRSRVTTESSPVAVGNWIDTDRTERAAKGSDFEEISVLNGDFTLIEHNPIASSGRYGIRLVGVAEYRLDSVAAEAKQD